MTGPTIGMALYGDLTFDSRVRREAATLAEAGYSVRLVCLGNAGGRADMPSGVEVIVRKPRASDVLPGGPNPDRAPKRRRSLDRLAARLRWLFGYARNLRAWGAEVVRVVGPVDAWHAHDLPALVAIAPNTSSAIPIIYDSHELFLNTATAGSLPGVVQRLLRRYERRLTRRARAVVTVSIDLAEILQDRYHPARVVVVHNCPPRWNNAGQPDLLREALGIAATAQVILYHGSIGPGRGIEPVLEAMLEPGLANAHFVMLGPGDPRGDYARLANEPRFGGRVHILPAVPPADLLNWVCGADVSGVLRGNTSLNDYLSTPNKLFESIAAGVPVVGSNYPAIRRIVQDQALGPLGALADPADAAAVSVALQSVLGLDGDRRAALRECCLIAARERWNWEVQSSALVTLYADLLGAAPQRK